MTPNDAIRVVNETPIGNHLTGSDAHFVPINASWGLKYFQHKHTRDITYYFQRMAAKLGCAPQIGDRVEFNLGTETYYGYVTERIMDTGDDICAELDVIRNHPYEKTLKFNINASLHEISIKLRYAYKMDLIDIHAGNYGIMANGDIGIIDFSRCKLEHWDEPAQFMPKNFNMEAEINRLGIQA